MVHTKRILSVDVGIRNFSYCVVDYRPGRSTEERSAEERSIEERSTEGPERSTEDPEIVRINKWGVFDLCPPSDAPSKCDFCAAKCMFFAAKFPPRKTVTRKPIDPLPDGEPEQRRHLCTRHASTMYFTRSQTKEYTLKYLTRMHRVRLGTLIAEHAMADAPEFQHCCANWTTRVGLGSEATPALSPGEMKKIVRGVYDWFQNRTCTLIPKVSATKVSLTGVGVRLAHLAAEHQIFAGVDCLVIENQIGNVAVRMKSIQEMTTVIAVFAGVSHIHPVSSSGKLTNTRVDRSDAPSTNVTYRERKLDGVERVNQWLKTDSLSVWKDQFTAAKKKDDMADSFLQAMWFLRNPTS